MPLGTRVGSDLSGERRRLARALEARGAGRFPRDHVPLSVRATIVLLNDVLMCAGDGDVLLDTTRAATGRLSEEVPSTPSPSSRGRRSSSGALARAVRLRPLSMHREATAVPDAAQAADLRQTLDRLGALAAKVALDLQLAVDVAAKLVDLVVREVFHFLVRVELERLADLLRGRLSDPVDVGQPDLQTLLVREVDAGDSCQVVTPAFACGADSCK